MPVGWGLAEAVQRTSLLPPPHQRSSRVSLKLNLEACLLGLWVMVFCILMLVQLLNNGRRLIEDLLLLYLSSKEKPLSVLSFSKIRGF